MLSWALRKHRLWFCKASPIPRQRPSMSSLVRKPSMPSMPSPACICLTYSQGRSSKIRRSRMSWSSIASQIQPTTSSCTARGRMYVQMWLFLLLLLLCCCGIASRGCSAPMGNHDIHLEPMISFIHRKPCCERASGWAGACRLRHRDRH